jgi:hypothetical protein
MKMKIADLSIQERYFVGSWELNGRKYSLNIQNQGGGKVVKFPFEYDGEDVVVKLEGRNFSSSRS